MFQVRLHPSTSRPCLSHSFITLHLLSLQTTTIALCALLLVQLVTAKYATSLTSDAQYLGTGAAAAGGVQDGSQLDLGNMLNLNELVSGLSYQSNGPVSAAIQTRRSVEVRPVKTAQEAVEPHVVDVEATYQPVHVVFRSASSPVMVQQIHTPAQPSQVKRMTIFLRRLIGKGL